MTTITPQILLKAYASGIFPMAENSSDSALYWIEPELRGVIPLDGFHIPRSLRKLCRQAPFEIRVDSAFGDVIDMCAARTDTRDSTWINARIRSLYTQLFKMGFCHSVECWRDGALVGGLYGVHIGSAFFGESMFSRHRDASKVALVHLVARLNAGSFTLLDAQFINDHLVQFGAKEISRTDYRDLLADALTHNADFSTFNADDDAEIVLDMAQPCE